MSRNSLKLIRGFINQEFLESSVVALIKLRVEIVRKIRDVVEQFLGSQEQMVKVFRLDSSDPSIYVEVDEVKFIQVIINLLSNAVKFTPGGGVIAVAIQDQEPAGTVLFTVADNGIGIPEKDHATLFDKFTKAHRPGLRNEPGVGLGMSIIKTIVGWHGCKIWFESGENQGTAFFIEISRPA